MLQFIITIIVVIQFTKLAGEKNLNKSFWGIIGAASYCIPTLIMSYKILPALITTRIIPTMDQINLTLLSFGANLLAGFLWSYMAYGKLRSRSPIVDQPTLILSGQENDL